MRLVSDADEGLAALATVLLLAQVEAPERIAAVGGARAARQAGPALLTGADRVERTVTVARAGVGAEAAREVAARAADPVAVRIRAARAAELAAVPSERAPAGQGSGRQQREQQDAEGTHVA